MPKASDRANLGFSAPTKRSILSRPVLPSPSEPTSNATDPGQVRPGAYLSYAEEEEKTVNVLEILAARFRN
jgi:hypothetical protein